MKRIFLIILACWAMLSVASAQELTVKEMKATNDISASQYERKDLNGQACALIKVSLPSPGVLFEGNVIEPVEYKTGEFWVYMSSGSKELRIKHPQTHPLHVRFDEYGIKKVESKSTYYLTVLIPSVAAQQPQAQNQTQNQEIANNDTPKDIETITVNGISFKMIRADGNTASYSIGETEVTQALWQTVMGNNPSFFKGSNLPVENVSWDDCQEFIQKLNQLTGRQFRLPTEAEWEYAARGGSKSNDYPYSGSNHVEKVAWTRDNSNKKTHKVKTKQANELGLYDMNGNVWEWCQDKADKNKSSSLGNSQDFRIQRGGSWRNGANGCDIPAFIHASPSNKDSNIGLRLAL